VPPDGRDAPRDGLAQLRLFAGTVRTLAGIPGSTLLRVIFPVWIGSGLAFLAVAACINMLVNVSDLGFGLDRSTIYTAYLILGVIAGTLLACGLALERSMPAVQQHLDAATARIVEAFAHEAALDRQITVQQLVERLEPAMREINSRTAGLRRFTPAGALARLLVRQLAPELEALAGVSSSVSQPGKAAEAISTHAAAAAGAHLGRHARRAWMLTVVAWLLIFALSTLPLVLLRP
jgi:hypothetical protein